VIGRLARAGLLTGVVDGLFSSALAQFAYGSGVMRLWQGVAATAFGAGAFGGGYTLAIAGLVVHFGVACAWSAVFLLAYQSSPGLRRGAASPFGVMQIAAIYGPLIWVAMSAVVIPAMTGRPPVINERWWIQFFGHAIFVAMPIVAVIARTRRES
jgi:uncharacterized membrane protein YagU involved in acid resistance